jgi:hypothetical protein
MSAKQHVTDTIASQLAGRPDVDTKDHPVDPALALLAEVEERLTASEAQVADLLKRVDKLEGV